jgi:cytochrome c biogenesis protein CcdA
MGLSRSVVGNRSAPETAWMDQWKYITDVAANKQITNRIMGFSTSNSVFPCIIPPVCSILIYSSITNVTWS